MRTAKEAARGHSISIVIAVLHEAERISSVIDHLKSQNGSHSCEIIVVDGDTEAGTLNAIAHEGVVKLTSEKGRAKQMNAGAKLAKSDILLFLHADTKLPAGAFDEISGVLEDGRYVAGAFDLGIATENWLIKAIATAGRIRSRLTRIPYGDQAIFLRKEYFKEIGGFKDIGLMEDVELMQRIKRRGGRIFILPDRVETSARRWEEEGIFYTTFRNLVLVSLYYLGVNPDKLVRFYRSGYGSGRK
ncbi:MAG: TIGR04283 family arsenosugar biosynthesis glycosyltransferase [Planctomycetes bacterium]|nr:TIGR04283 family arsenosugar biosynthesis glycosyltransferase [Planctomycetota bacterium]